MPSKTIDEYLKTISSQDKSALQDIRQMGKENGIAHQPDTFKPANSTEQKLNERVIVHLESVQRDADKTKEAESSGAKLRPMDQHNIDIEQSKAQEPEMDKSGITREREKDEGPELEP